jgi:tRNA (Thr-GGU) A37 N-methylase
MGRQDLPEVGIFATRSPRRPNSILVTAVELVARRGNVLEVRGLDAVDGTPVIDIKPLTPGDCPTGELRVPEWLAGVHREFAELDDGTSPPDD